MEKINNEIINIENEKDDFLVLIKEMSDKINEIIDWINNQE